MRLVGKTAIVAGAASGIGLGISEKFLAEGAKVLMANINGEAVADQASCLGKMAIAMHTDVASSAATAQMHDASQTALGAVDIIVNNAGVTHLPDPLEDISEKDFDRVFAVNCKSIYLISRAFVPALKARRNGMILNIASTAGVSPQPNLSWYNSSKDWVNTATRTMAVELAPFGVRVNALNPVAGETPLLTSFMGEDTPKMRAKFLSTIPLGRFSTAKNMSNAACYLCSNETSMVTGACMQIDGKRYI